MALKTNSKEVRQSIREHIRESLPGFSASDTGRSPATEPTAYDALQVLKQETMHVWARYGGHEAFKDWVQGLAFGDFMDAREIVSEWLKQTPEEVAKYPHEKSEELYIRLLDREFFKMAAEDAPESGYRIDISPYIDRRAPARGAVLCKVDVYRDGDIAASVGGLEPWQGDRLHDILARSVRETGDLPHGIKAAAESQAYGTLKNALQAVADRALPRIRDAERAIDEWRRGTIDEGTSHTRMGALGRALENDAGLSTGLRDFVYEEIERYFAESGCRAEKGLGAKAAENGAAFTPIAHAKDADESDSREIMPRLRSEGGRCVRASAQIAASQPGPKEAAAPSAEAPKKLDGGR